MKYRGIQNDPIAWAMYQREWTARNPASRRRTRLKHRYGITPEEYDELLEKQNGKCALCARTPEQERHGVLRIDHCHETGKVRGLLCDNHNRALGNLGDTKEAITKVLNYLIRDGLNGQ